MFTLTKIRYRISINNKNKLFIIKYIKKTLKFRIILKIKKVFLVKGEQLICRLKGWSLSMNRELIGKLMKNFLLRRLVFWFKVTGDKKSLWTTSKLLIRNRLHLLQVLLLKAREILRIRRQLVRKKFGKIRRAD
jgi:hypothetical protein